MCGISLFEAVQGEKRRWTELDTSSVNQVWKDNDGMYFIEEEKTETNSRVERTCERDSPRSQSSWETKMAKLCYPLPC